jgi:hypothetical protein
LLNFKIKKYGDRSGKFVFNLLDNTIAVSMFSCPFKNQPEVYIYFFLKDRNANFLKIHELSYMEKIKSERDFCIKFEE